MDPDKVFAMANWPTPKSGRDVHRFLGFANYYRKFIKNFSSLEAPMHELTSPHRSFV